MPQSQLPRRAEAYRAIDDQISALKRELERVIDLPSTPSHLRARLIERLAALRVRPADRQRQQ
jgi:hypothetical protein